MARSTTATASVGRWAWASMGVGDGDVGELDVVAAGGAHAEGVPGVEGLEAGAGGRDTDHEDDFAGLGVVVDGHGGEEVGEGGLAAEDLAAGDAVAAVFL